ncbi:unnamed protein product [Ascophyllum nodosum]
MAKTPATAAVPIAAARRLLSTPPPKPEVIVTKPPGGGTKPPGGGSSFFQRLAAFLTGAGLGCGVGYYHLSKASAGIEIAGSTVALEVAISKSHRELSDRLTKLERKR